MTLTSDAINYRYQYQLLVVLYYNSKSNSLGSLAMLLRRDFFGDHDDIIAVVRRYLFHPIDGDHPIRDACL